MWCMRGTAPQLSWLLYRLLLAQCCRRLLCLLTNWQKQQRFLPTQQRPQQGQQLLLGLMHLQLHQLRRQRQRLKQQSLTQQQK